MAKISTALNRVDTNTVVDLISADLRNGTNGLRTRAREFGYAFTVEGETARGRNTLRPGQVVLFVNNKQTQVVALNHAGVMARSVDKGRQLTAADLRGVLTSFGITLDLRRKEPVIRNEPKATTVVVAGAAAPATVTVRVADGAAATDDIVTAAEAAVKTARSRKRAVAPKRATTTKNRDAEATTAS